MKLCHSLPTMQYRWTTPCIESLRRCKSDVLGARIECFRLAIFACIECSVHAGTAAIKLVAAASYREAGCHLSRAVKLLVAIPAGLVLGMIRPLYAVTVYERLSLVQSENMFSQAFVRVRNIVAKLWPSPSRRAILVAAAAALAVIGDYLLTKKIPFNEYTLVKGLYRLGELSILAAGVHAAYSRFMPLAPSVPPPIDPPPLDPPPIDPPPIIGDEDEEPPAPGFNFEFEFPFPCWTDTQIRDFIQKEDREIRTLIRGQYENPYYAFHLAYKKIAEIDAMFTELTENSRAIPAEIQQLNFNLHWSLRNSWYQYLSENQHLTYGDNLIEAMHFGTRIRLPLELPTHKEFQEVHLEYQTVMAARKLPEQVTVESINHWWQVGRMKALPDGINMYELVRGIYLLSEQSRGFAKPIVTEFFNKFSLPADEVALWGQVVSRVRPQATPACVASAVTRTIASIFLSDGVQKDESLARLVALREALAQAGILDVAFREFPILRRAVSNFDGVRPLAT